MTVLSLRLRKTLENAIREARIVAEEAAADAIKRLGIAASEAPAHLSEEQKALRRRLRAHARALGDTRDTKGEMTTRRLREAAGYELWHRMLFGRFLMERNLLLHPEFGVPISMAEAQEIAAEDKNQFPDEWAVAEHFAAPTLPMVFKPDDPVLALQFDPYFHARLRTLLTSMPEEVFEADDSLGWTYQFWRAAEKDAVNQSGVKIGAAELPAVTQLFTEPYMVKFLLHNTLGAWWAGKVLAAEPNLPVEAVDEQALRDACSLPGVGWEHLRFVRDDEGKGPWRPAAGTFPGWPDNASDITFCDPCCGSGHFLVEAFAILAAVRQAEERLSPEEACCAVLRDNLHGLEIDGRCVQIAAFNAALTAWRLAGRPTSLPLPHIAWVGAPPPMSRAEMAALANEDATLRNTMEALYDQFARAPLLGTLLEIGAKDLLDAAIRDRGEQALARLRGTETERAEGALAARGLLDAVSLLSRRYVLQATNVPFLGRGKQSLQLADFIASQMPEARADLATAMLQRMRRMATIGGAVASVTPQLWLFLGGYKEFRKQLLRGSSLSFAVGLGTRAFEAISGDVVNAALIVFQNTPPEVSAMFAAVDVNDAPQSQMKAELLCSGNIQTLSQDAQKKNPDERISLTKSGEKHRLLQEVSECYQGVVTGDIERFTRRFWENRGFSTKWAPLRGSSSEGNLFSGATDALLWEAGSGQLHRYAADTRDKLHDMHESGNKAWKKKGVAINRMHNLRTDFYLGEIYHNNVAVIFPKKEADLSAITAFCLSDEFFPEVRRIDRKVSLTNATLLKVPFDRERWAAKAAEMWPDGLPRPYSDDPTQWLFHGHPAFVATGAELHVALARLAGYRWPAETDTGIELSPLAADYINAAATLPIADMGGILPLYATATAKSLADRLRDFLCAAYGVEWTNVKEQHLVRAADMLLDKRESRDTTLEGWLRDRAFRQHCILFHQRPFVWHIWDGLRDGFSAFVHYHRFDRATLERLTYSLLGDWIARAKAEGQTAREERAEQLQQRLAAILMGEPPYDIFTRWKTLSRQPIGWEPDLDDGVRLNIRPFMEAEVLREIPRGIHWNKDRGSDVASAPWFDLGPRYGGKPGDRINDHHLTLAEKHAARERPRL